MMELQRAELAAIRGGDEPVAEEYRLAIFLKLEEAQAAALSAAE